ncbi:hypothetical protein WT08_28235 [Burkholderia sp. MSMB1552]|nr:hypothetical protein WT08_28235 [Burkholderia sp. MSMB1552]KWZ46961.1 hypothetical protein WS92_29935 [Burkholderia sp. MSMB1588]
MNKICRPKRTGISIAIAAAIAYGWTGSYAGTTNGDPNLGDGAIATGNGSRAVGDYSVAIGSGEQALGQNALAIGAGGIAVDVNAIALGTTAVAQASAVAVGTSATAAATAIALGANLSATVLAAIALGQGAGAVNAGDVAIGAGFVTAAARAVLPVTVAGRTYDLAGSPPESVVSFGTIGAERQLTNVAAGTISAVSTDAVNGSVLYAAYQAIQATSTYATLLSTSTGQSVASLSTGVAANGAALTALSTSLAAGALGLVQQTGGAPGAGTITIGASNGGNATAPANNAVALGPGTVAERDTPCRSATPQRGLRGRSPTFPRASRRPMRSTFNSSTTRWAACATRSSMTTVTPMAVPRRPSRSRVCRKRRVPGTSVVAIGGGSYAGQSAMAVGLSTYAGRWIFKASGSTNTRGAVAAGVGAGYAW